MWILFFISILGLLALVLLTTLALAAGLYYLAELIEEYTVITGKILRKIIIVEIVLYLLLYFEDFPAALVICGVTHHVANFLMIEKFPYFELLSTSSIVSFFTLIYCHYAAFAHLEEHFYTGTEALGFFTVCLWLIPFVFLISLSANENVLPTLAENINHAGSEEVFAAYYSKKRQRSGLLSVITNLKEKLFSSRERKLY
ncbi:protein TEX261-like [Artemia franciscana]